MGCVKSLTLIHETNQLCSRLSAFLFGIYDNQTYLEAARLSMSFIQSHLYNSTKMKCVNDIYDVLGCDKKDSEPESLESGLYLEALNVYAYKTRNNALVQKCVSPPLDIKNSNDHFRADQLASNVMKFSPWNTDDGIVHEGKTAHLTPLIRVEIYTAI